MSTSVVIAFVVGTLLFVVIPGPSVVFIVGRALAEGRRAALLTVAGNLVGVLVVLGLVAVGVGALVARAAPALVAIKVVGGCYLIWLGWRAVRDSDSLAARLTDCGSSEPERPDRPLREGVVVGVTNPKSLVFFTAVLPQFVTAEGAPAPVQIALLGTVFCLLASSVDLGWAVLAGTARDRLSRSPTAVRRAAAAGGVMLIGLGATTAVSARS